jgi:glycosyltransferase involved in cell wall biosynthesis
MISIFTPTNNPKYLHQTFQSLKEQTFKDFEWVLVLNGEASEADILDYLAPSGIKYQILHADLSGVGALKKHACMHAQGDILLELDHDDLLVPTALEKVNQAFEDPSVQFVYSNDAEFRDGTWESKAYSEYWGWRSRPFFYQGHELKEMIAWEPSPHMMRRIEWAPDHVRSFRKSAYEDVGGHDASLKLSDDHDLCCRFYLKYGAAGFRHIDECLYLYRLHDTNTCRLWNNEVQDQTLRNYLKYSRDMAIRGAKDQGLLLLDLGGRFNAWEGFTTVDLLDADIIADLESPWPWADNSVGVIRASHVFEHLKDPIHTMNEAYRVLAPGGWLFIDVPSTEGRGAWQDPTHKTFWNENSFLYYTNRDFARFIKPAYTGRFQNARTVTFYPTQWEKDHQVPWVQADLIALKAPYDDRPVGEVLI